MHKSCEEFLKKATFKTTYENIVAFIDTLFHCGLETGVKFKEDQFTDVISFSFTRNSTLKCRIQVETFRYILMFEEEGFDYYYFTEKECLKNMMKKLWRLGLIWKVLDEI